MNTTSQSKRAKAVQQAKKARSNLLLMIIFTAINMLLFIAGSTTMFLFSATVPYFLTIFGVIIGLTQIKVFCISIAVIILAVYLLCWLFSKNHYGWMIAALVLFSLDMIANVFINITEKNVSGIMDMVIHIWVLFYLIIGVKSGYQLKNLPPEPETAAQTIDEGDVSENEVPSQPADIG